MIRVVWDAVNGAYIDTLRSLIMTHTFGAQIWVNDVDFITLGNGPVRAFGFADITVDTFVGNY